MAKAQIISALQKKGGAYKSTMIQCIAACMGRDGAKVLIIDTDHDQYSCIDWSKEQDIENVDTLQHNDEDTLIEIISKLSDNYDAIFIDTGGYDSRMATYAIQASDLILIPSGGSKSNIRGAAKTWHHADTSTNKYAHPPTIRLVMWGIKKQTEVYKHAKQTLIDAKLPVLSFHVGNYTGFEAMSWNGGLPNGVAKMALNEFMASLQMENLIDFYRQDKEVLDGAAA